MFRFAHTEYLFLFIPVLFLVLVFFYSQFKSKRKMANWGNRDLLKPLMPNSSFYKKRLKFYFQFMAIALLVIVLAQPQFGVKEQTVKKKGREIMIAFDVSNSMLAQDIQPNRMEKAKWILSKLIDRMENDKVGLIVFAGDAYMQMPITSDYQSAKMFLSSINTQMVPRQGTAIGSAIDMAIQSFSNKESTTGKAIILLTDAENHEDDAISAAKLAYKNNIQVFVVGMGTPNGAPIQLGQTMSFKKDNKGNVVVTKLNEKVATEIAKAGKGVYVRADNGSNALNMIAKELDKMQKNVTEQKVYGNYNEQFQSFAILAFLLLLIDFFIFGRKNKWLSKIKFFDVELN